MDVRESPLAPLERMAETAYLAGFFDGEGCILVNKDSLRLVVAQVNPAPLQLLQGRYGGTIRHRPATDSTRFAYIWSVMARGAEAALREMLPHLLVKREEAEVAIAFTETIGHGFQRVSDDVRYVREELKNRLAFLKRREYSPETLAEAKVEEYFAEAI